MLAVARGGMFHDVANLLSLALASSIFRDVARRAKRVLSLIQALVQVCRQLLEATL